VGRFFTFITGESDKLLQQALVHSGLVFLSLFIAVLLSVPLGIFITRKKKLSGPVLGFVGILQTIPSIALLGFMIPLLGIGAKPAIIALCFYALLPIVRYTYTGFIEVVPAVKAAVFGIGVAGWQVVGKGELPFAFPVNLSGTKTAPGFNVGGGYLGANFGAGGLGEFIFGGIALNNSVMILAGAIPAALLA